MRYSSQVKPIGYLKANAAEVLNHLAENREPLVITQNGKAKAVLQDVASFEETQETLALLKILALGQQDVEQDRIKPVADVVKASCASMRISSSVSRQSLVKPGQTTSTLLSPSRAMRSSVGWV